MSARLDQASLPHAVAVDEIVEHLKPLKPDVGDPRSDIILTIDVIKDVAPKLAPLLRWREVRDKADPAEKALSILLNVLPAEMMPVFAQAQKQAEILRHIESSVDSRTNVLQWLCANSACSLIEYLSNKEPSSAPSGNLHCIAVIIHSVLAPDQPMTEYTLLRVCRDVRKWREEIRELKRILAKKPDDAL